MDKIYEYKGKHYCETDISHRDDDYAGSLYDLYWELKKDGKANENTIYWKEEDGSQYYDGAEEMIEGEFKDLVIGSATEEDKEENRKFWKRVRAERMMQET